MTGEDDLRPGQVRLRNVSRSFNVVHDRNATLKDALVRRRRSQTTRLWALKEVDLDIAPGESVGLIGQNGTGKSTLLKLVAGILTPQSGSVEAGGMIASMLELGAGFHPDFTGRENVYLSASIYGLSETAVDARFDEILAFGELEEFIDMPVRTYSSGMYMRLGFAIASHVSPDILLLDEVLAVGDESFQHKCTGRIQQFHRDGGTLLYVSHDPASVARMCERAILLVDGQVLADGAPVDVMAEYHSMLAGGGSGGSRPRSVGEGHDATARASGQREWGNRAITISEVALIGPDGPTDRFLSGQPVTIRLTIDAQDAVRDPTFGVLIHSAGGILCYGTNTGIDPLDVPEVRGRAQIDFHVPALHLHEGEFTVSVAAHSVDETVVYHWRDRCATFTVFGARPGIGVVDIAGRWTLTPLGDTREPDSADDIRNAGQSASVGDPHHQGT